MAKKAEHEVSVTRSELQKLPKNRQRYLVDIGAVVDEPKKADSK